MTTQEANQLNWVDNLLQKNGLKLMIGVGVGSHDNQSC